MILTAPEPPTEVFENLWVGPYPTKRVEAKDFDALVLAAKEHQTPEKAGDDVEFLLVPLADDPSSPMPYRQVLMAQRAAQWVTERLDFGERVLVSCEAGLNRSALIAGMALMKRTQLSAASVIALMREKRGPEAFFNKQFVKVLKSCT